MDMDNNEICDKLKDLLIKSEERIDRTNKMVCDCVSVVNKLTDAYSEHIVKLQTSRDNLIEQNSQLIKLLQKEQDSVDYMNKKFELFIEKLLTNKCGSENNINVK